MIQSYGMKMSERSESADEMDITIKEEFYQLASDGINYEKIPDKYQSMMSQSTKDIPSSLRCRLCAVQNDDMIDIFTIHETEGNIAEKIEYCLRIVVNESDNLPKRICWFCSEQLELCYQFNQIVEEANRQFRAPDKQTSVKLEETATDFRPSSRNSYCEALFHHSIDETDSKSATIAEEVPTTGSTVENTLALSSLKPSSEVLDASATLRANNLITVEEEISSNVQNEQVDSSTFDLNSGRTSPLDIVQQTTCDSRVSSTFCTRSQPKKQNSSTQCERGAEDQGNLAVPGGTDTKKRCSRYMSAGTQTEVPTAMTEKVCREACEKTSIAPSDLKVQFKKLKKRTDYFCSMCDKSFKHLSTMKIHMTVHSDKRPWECDYCKKSFKTKGHLKKHLTVCKNRPKSREKIHKRKSYATLFSTQADLIGHKRLDKDSRLHSCDYCKKSFKTNGHLNEHLTVCKKRPEAKGTIQTYVACAALFTPEAGLHIEFPTVAEQSIGPNLRKSLFSANSDRSSGVFHPNETTNNLTKYRKRSSSDNERQKLYSSAVDVNPGRPTALDIVQKSTCDSKVSLMTCGKSKAHKKKRLQAPEASGFQQKRIRRSRGTHTRRSSRSESIAVQTMVQATCSYDSRRLS